MLRLVARRWRWISRGFQVDLAAELGRVLGTDAVVTLKPWTQTEADLRAGRGEARSAFLARRARDRRAMTCRRLELAVVAIEFGGAKPCSPRQSPQVASAAVTAARAASRWGAGMAR